MLKCEKSYYVMKFFDQKKKTTGNALKIYNVIFYLSDIRYTTLAICLITLPSPRVHVEVGGHMQGCDVLTM